jgi:hypothetical protein
MTKHYLLITISLTVLFSCKRKPNEIDFEKKVLLEVLPAIVDSTCRDSRLIMFPPPYPLYPPKGFEISDSEKAERIKKSEALRNMILNDTSSIFLAFNPEIKLPKGLGKHDPFIIEEFKKYLKGKKQASIQPKNYSIDISQIKLDRKFKLTHDSIFPKDYTVWKKKYDFVFSGFFGVSRIIFDENKTLGILETWYTCESRCGYGHLVFLKKINNKWIIDKVQMTWIS